MKFHGLFFVFSVRHKAEADFWPEKSRKKATSNQINQQRRKNQTDYENLLLLQARILCFKFSLNQLRFSLTRETDTKYFEPIAEEL